MSKIRKTQLRTSNLWAFFSFPWRSYPVTSVNLEQAPAHDLTHHLCLPQCLPQQRPPDPTPISDVVIPSLCLHCSANWRTFFCDFCVWTLGKPSYHALVHPNKKQLLCGDVMTWQWRHTWPLWPNMESGSWRDDITRNCAGERILSHLV